MAFDGVPPTGVARPLLGGVAKAAAALSRQFHVPCLTTDSLSSAQTGSVCEFRQGKVHAPDSSVDCGSLSMLSSSGGEERSDVLDAR